MSRYKAVLNIFMADRLLKAGFIPVEFKPCGNKGEKIMQLF